MIMCIVGGCPYCTVWNDVHTSLRSLKPEMNNSEKLTWALVVIRGFYRFFKEKTHTQKKQTKNNLDMNYSKVFILFTFVNI